MNQTATVERPQVTDFAPSQARSNLAVVPPPASASALGRATAYPPKLAGTLVAITREFGAIAKAANKDDPNGGWNSFHNYGYQKWDDVLDRESTLFQHHGIILQQSEIARSLLDKLISITYEFTIINEDGEAWPDRPVFTAIGRLQDHKGIFDDKAANKCHTQAHKYFLVHTFKIKTKEALEADADAGEGDVPDKQVSSPKPPKPGSEEAKAMEGPRPIVANGHNAESWSSAFILAIETATLPEIDQWTEANRNSLSQLEKYPEVFDKVQKAIETRRKSFAAIKPPKPPRPEAAKPQMPDPTKDGAGWIVWLTDKFAAFETYDEGEAYWNRTVEPTMDGLDQLITEDANGIWRKFERRFEP